MIEQPHDTRSVDPGNAVGFCGRRVVLLGGGRGGR